ncbi:hypothetical protein K438DRAFT_1774840 [Mycena galopus ATCC 62051]|nr:hypothetical protein K438DRAFT_1774840 [Mycena galopus ATCC 62051]
MSTNEATNRRRGDRRRQWWRQRRRNFPVLMAVAYRGLSKCFLAIGLTPGVNGPWSPVVGAVNINRHNGMSRHSMTSGAMVALDSSADLQMEVAQKSTRYTTALTSSSIGGSCISTFEENEEKSKDDLEEVGTVFLDDATENNEAHVAMHQEWPSGGNRQGLSATDLSV